MERHERHINGTNNNVQVGKSEMQSLEDIGRVNKVTREDQVRLTGAEPVRAHEAHMDRKLQQEDNGHNNKPELEAKLAADYKAPLTPDEEMKNAEDAAVQARKEAIKAEEEKSFDGAEDGEPKLTEESRQLAAEEAEEAPAAEESIAAEEEKRQFGGDEDEELPEITETAPADSDIQFEEPLEEEPAAADAKPSKKKKDDSGFFGLKHKSNKSK